MSGATGSASQIWLIVLSIAIAAGTLFLIPVLVELRRSVKTLNAMLKITEESLQPTLRDLRTTLQNLDRITTDISTVTDDVRVFSGSVRQVGKDIEELTGLVSVASRDLGAKISGLRAGVGAGVAHFARNLLKKGGRA